MFSSPSLPMGPQRTNSMRPSLGSASGAIIMVPPVYLLLLKVRKRERTLIPVAVGVATHIEAAALELRDADEYAEQISEVAKGLEDAIGQRANIGGKPDAEKIEGIDRPGGMA